MSFSVSCIGRPEAIKRRLAKESENLSGQSKQEFDDVRPALETVLDQNVGDAVVHLEAHGHADFVDGVKKFGQCTVNIRKLGTLVE